MKRRSVSFFKVSLVAALATLIVIECYQPSFAQEALTGHKWRTLPLSFKTIFVRAFLPGFISGYSKGNLIGFTETYIWAAWFCKDEKGNPCIKATVNEVLK